VSATEGKSALTERVQRQGGNGWLQGSEGVRAVRSRSDGGRGPRGSEGVRAVRSRLDGGIIRPGKQTCAKRYPRSEPFDLNWTEGIRPRKQTAVGGAAPLRGDADAEVEAGAGYGGSRVAGVR
jgi:hypothetical protein